MRRNQKGFSAVEGILIFIIVAIIAGVGWYVWDSNKKTNDILNSADNTKIASPTKNEPKTNESKDESVSWPRIESGKKTFSAQIPNGWGSLYRALDSEALFIGGVKQPVYVKDAEVKVTDLEASGSDSPRVFEIFIYDNVSEPRGIATDFNIGSLAGKKYFYEAQKDGEPGLGQEHKGDKYYEYRFDLKDNKKLVIWYNVYAASDNNDQSAIVDKIVKSIKLN
jgi:hypothetical protein